ncbi:MAG: anti-sigma factor [Bacteroidota bacterium]
MDREEFIQLSSEYALGALEGDELRKFEAYLKTASKQELEILSELTSTASLIPLALERSTPSPAVKQSLMQKINLSSRGHEAVRQRTEILTQHAPARTRNWIPWGIAASLAMVAVFSLFVIKLMGTIEKQNRQLAVVEQEKQELQTRLVSLRDDLTRKNEQLKVLSAKQIHISIMDGLKVNPIGYGKIIWDPEKRSAILQVSNLPAVPSDKDYQLWVIKGKKPISAGVFAVNDTSSNFFKIENLAVTNPKEIAAFAVTLEPKGGMPQPTGDMYMMGAPRL